MVGPRPIAIKYNLVGSMMVLYGEIMIEVGFGGTKSSVSSSRVPTAVKSVSSPDIGCGDEALELQQGR